MCSEIGEVRKEFGDHFAALVNGIIYEERTPQSNLRIQALTEDHFVPKLRDSRMEKNYGTRPNILHVSDG